MSERSEFGRRAASAEERRVPMQLHRIGTRPGASGFGYFCRNKSNPLKAEALDVLQTVEPKRVICQFEWPERAAAD